MKLKCLSLEDKKIFDKYLNLSRHDLSVYAFPNIYIWKVFFKIQWQIIEGGLYIFFSDKIGSFLYLDPLAENLTPGGLSQAFQILDSLNKNREISRVENAEERNLTFYRKLGFGYKQKSSDYVCLSRDLSGLRGNAFKSKRVSYNFFVKNYNHSLKKFSTKDKSSCLKLYDLWAAQREDNSKDDFYKFMLEDSRKSLGALLTNYKDLDCVGKLVKVNNELKGFTFGFKLNGDTFCILFEITDLGIKGLAQFIFREFSREMSDYKYINIMDDSGLENLKRVKLSYHPVKLVPAFIVRKNAE